MNVSRISPVILAAAAALLAPASARGQTDYYNTDKGRPLHIEDAYPVERRAFEIQVAPVRIERGAGGVYHWSVEPELAFGFLPRTQIELGVPLSFIDAAGRRRSGMSGLELSLLHNLNVETTLPALAVAVAALAPVGNLAPANPYFSIKGIATRTFSGLRLHVNGEYTAGAAPTAADAAPIEATRWSAGLAADHTFPLRSLLVGAEVVVHQPLLAAADPFLIAGGGIRYQLTPRWGLDAGVGTRFTGDERTWYVTAGSSYAFGFPWYPRGQR